ncbi:tRNA(Ile)-lysidine synthetase [Exophiala spinifera]|uniref:tRNA(Ile)-lysidine synthetase n=1 Tax=Exophiala spinifera TaxID=91928 RepID=A0A0D2B4P8_9EURO|nr:tRNA(Ile)-lysidine synthetase [Exophiala spinifera]KIW13675.1 tRNA(Ile)-lysidine synthetase [Exophiala spinifera]
MAKLEKLLRIPLSTKKISQLTGRPSPVTLEEFLPCLGGLRTNDISGHGTQKPSFVGIHYSPSFNNSVLPLTFAGVCVSGGPDSMALAWLLRQISMFDKHLPIEPVAFIVDHRAREGSREEAEFVAGELDKLGIANLILTMTWPGIARPSQLSDFENRARESRYRLIAKAAIERNIRHLFVGHHQDDQVETVLMRLLRNAPSNFLGLQGMAATTAIPCCESVRGAHEWPGYESFPEWIRRRDAPTYKRQVEAEADLRIASSANFEKLVTMPRSEGLLIHRPLLIFPKSRLVEVCDVHKINYVRDKTNNDPTLTMRNSLRYLRSTHVLPRALQAESILGLAQWAQNKTQALVKRGTNLLNTLQDLTFDLRSGVLTVRVPKDFVLACKSDPDAAANALARLTSVVSFQPRDSVPSVISWQNIQDFRQQNLSPRSQCLTIQRAFLRKLTDRTRGEEGSVVWRLSRPPMRAAEVERATMKFTPREEHETASAVQQGNPGVASNQGIWSAWLFWDHRYWIRIRAKDADTLDQIEVRPFQNADESYLRHNHEGERDVLQKMFAKVAPGKLRYTLPVLTWQGNVCVFPTLNFLVQKKHPSSVSLPVQHPALEWEICYKSIDEYFLTERKISIDWRSVET